VAVLDEEKLAWAWRRTCLDVCRSSLGPKTIV